MDPSRAGGRQGLAAVCRRPLYLMLPAVQHSVCSSATHHLSPNLRKPGACSSTNTYLDDLTCRSTRATASGRARLPTPGYTTRQLACFLTSWLSSPASGQPPTLLVASSSRIQHYMEKLWNIA